jgi:hypothetical protein
VPRPTSGYDQMQPLPMNEYVQNKLKKARGVNVKFDMANGTCCLV